MNRTERRERKINAMIAASARVADGVMRLKKEQEEVPLYKKIAFSTLNQIRSIAARAQMRREQLYFAAEERCSEPRLVFPFYLDGNRLNIISPEFKEEYKQTC